MVGAQSFVPSGTSVRVLGYCRPDRGKTPAGNDRMVVPA
jgi:hypothetical protein